MKISAAIPQKAASAPVAPKPIVPVQGSASEYVVEEKEMGGFITKLQGFEQEVMTVPISMTGLKTICCAPGSTAVEYARKHGIQCKSL